jgi:hypothetical protein
MLVTRPAHGDIGHQGLQLFQQAPPLWVGQSSALQGLVQPLKGGVDRAF